MPPTPAVKQSSRSNRTRSSSPSLFKRITHGSRERQAIAILRIATGAFLFYLGIAKLNTPNLPKLLADTIKIWAATHPQPVYQAFLETVILPNTAFFAQFVTIAEILIGVSYLLGGFTRYTSSLGLFLNINFFLATQHMGADALGINVAFIMIHSVLLWAKSGHCYGLDTLLAGKFGVEKPARQSSKLRVKKGSSRKQANGTPQETITASGTSNRRRVTSERQRVQKAIHAAVSTPSPKNIRPPESQARPPKPEAAEPPVISPKIRDLRD